MNPRILIVVLILVVLIAVVGVVVVPQLLRPSTPAAQTGVTPQAGQPARATEGPTPTPLEVVQIVVAVQELPRGFLITEDSVRLSPWPKALAPFNAMTSIDDVVGKIARSDIAREQPVISTMLVTSLEEGRGLARVGSDAAAVLPGDRVAVALPIDRVTSVAYAVQQGDRVDIILSMLFVDVDEIFQSLVPNQLTLFTITEEGDIKFLTGIAGRPDTTALGPVIIGPSERQRPRLVTQMTVQDALVVYVGNFPVSGRFLGIPPTPTPRPADAQQQQAQQQQGGGTPVPTPTPARPDIITLGVSPQDAVVLTWAVEAKLPVTLALRSANGTSRAPTEPVTLDYIMGRFNITLPSKRPYTIEPAIRSIRQLIAGEEITLSDNTAAAQR